MLRVVQAQSTMIRQRAAKASGSRMGRSMSLNSKPSFLEGDAGAAATHVHHALTTFLAVATPAVFLMPDSMSEGLVDKAFGVLVAASVSAHSWVGLNYVVTDYVPKVSKSLVGPARVVTAGIGAISLLGLGKIALTSEGGIKGLIKGLWRPKPKQTE